MTTMRAKVVVQTVTPNFNTADLGGKKYSETIRFAGVCKDGPYPEDGRDENNSFALWSPYVNYEMSITNPDLWDKFTVGQMFYVDFTETTK
jgi:hypothetical protein